MTKKVLTLLREEKGWSKNRLFLESGVSSSDICKVEKGIYLAYPPQREKLAKALGYEGNPDDLLNEVES